jgi:hypothetical protein
MLLSGRKAAEIALNKLQNMEESPKIKVK